MPTLPQCLWVFALLGPPFGYVTFISLLAVGRAEKVSDVFLLTLALVVFAPFGLPVAWVVGSVPAILVGVVYWSVRTRAGAAGTTAVAIAALCAALVCAGATAFPDGNFSHLREIESWLVFIIPGVAAALLCALLIERRLKVRPLRS